MVKSVLRIEPNRDQGVLFNPCYWNVRFSGIEIKLRTSPYWFPCKLESVLGHACTLVSISKYHEDEGRRGKNPWLKCIRDDKFTVGEHTVKSVCRRAEHFCKTLKCTRYQEECLGREAY